jgi:hypothetical protein
MKYRFSMPEHAIEVKFFCGAPSSGFVGFHGYQPLGGHELPIADCDDPVCVKLAIGNRQ